jgi:hypothetical protein
VSLPAQQECCLNVSLLLLRFNIDQDSLLFLCLFFSHLAQVAPSQSSEDVSASAQAPVMLVNCPSSPVKVVTEEQPLVPDVEEDAKSSPPVFFRCCFFSFTFETFYWTLSFSELCCSPRTCQSE